MERFDRLLQEQQVAIQQTDETIEKLSNFCQDYKRLMPRLEELSKHFTKRAIIPFSPKAFVPAQLIHTNEVLVHLGGNAEHFCEMSTHQALSLLASRIKRVEADISKLNEQRKLLTDREMLTSNLARGSNPSSLNADAQETNEFEIREKYDPAQEEEWLKQHRQRTAVERKKEQDRPRQQRVRFKESPSSSPDGDTESSGSECSTLPMISFHHSNQLPLPTKAAITDWSQASPADVVCYFQNLQRKFLESSLPADANAPVQTGEEAERKPGQSPLGNVIEHVVSEHNANAPVRTEGEVPPKPRPSPFGDAVEHVVSEHNVDASVRTAEEVHPKPRPSPFGDVIEHEDSEAEHNPPHSILTSTVPEKPVSRFRALCSQRSSRN